MCVNIILDDESFCWLVSSEELFQFREMWLTGCSIPEIASVMKRTLLEVSLIIMDQSFKGKLNQGKMRYSDNKKTRITPTLDQ